MSYSRLESSLPRHPKTARLARTLGISRVEAVGWLACWWCWVQETRPGGDLSGIEPADLDLALDWTGRGSLTEALLACGWIDRRDDGVLEVHGWLERAESYMRAQTEARRRSERRVPPPATPEPHVPHACPTPEPHVPHAPPHRGGAEERRGEERKEEDHDRARGADASRARARDHGQDEGQGQDHGPQPRPEPDPHGPAEPEDVERRHATSGRYRLPCPPQAVLDAWERVCVPAGHPRAVATGERLSAELAQAVTRALQAAPHRGAVWWEGTYLPALVADPAMGAGTRRRTGACGLALACRESVISEVLARAEARARASPQDASSPEFLARVRRVQAELRGEVET